MTCCVLLLTEERNVALHVANRVRRCPDSLLPIPAERKNSPPFLSLSSLPVSQLYMFNELASFLHPPPTATFPPCPHLLFLVALSFLYPMFFLLAFTTLQRGLREKTTLCYQETFFFCHSISLSQSHIPCQECEICKGGKITLLQK